MEQTETDQPVKKITQTISLYVKKHEHDYYMALERHERLKRCDEARKILLAGCPDKTA